MIYMFKLSDSFVSMFTGFFVSTSLFPAKYGNADFGYYKSPSANALKAKAVANMTVIPIV
jgi:hypothetical protein